jgi:hypothetical protein
MPRRKAATAPPAPPKPSRRRLQPVCTRWTAPGPAHFRLLEPKARPWTANQLDSEPHGQERLFISRRPKPRYREVVSAVHFRLGRPGPVACVELKRGVPAAALGPELLELLGGIDTGTLMVLPEASK